MNLHNNGHDHLPKDFLGLAARLAKLREQAEALGLFLHDRELLTCPTCGLLEDVLFEGTLVVELPDKPGLDTGLRFAERDSDSGIYRCPSCSTEFPAPDGEQ